MYLSKTIKTIMLSTKRSLAESKPKGAIKALSACPKEEVLITLRVCRYLESAILTVR